MSTALPGFLGASKMGRAVSRLAWWLWLLMLVTIPVTSFPPVARFVGDSSVYPLSGLVLAMLVILWLVPYVLADGQFPTPVWPLMFFVLVALAAAAIGLTLPISPYKGQTPVGREVRALATLAVGVSFYLCASTLPDSEERIRASLKALALGAVLMLAWSTVQAVWVTDGVQNIPPALNKIQRMISIRDLVRNRVSGMAFEPSWLGDQLVVLYLPIWLGSLLSKYTAFGRRRTYFSAELILFLWGVVILVLSRSRVSMASFLMMGVLLYGLLAHHFSKRVGRRGPRSDAKRSRLALRFGVMAVSLALGLVAFLGLVYGLVKVGAHYDWRLRRVLQIPNEIVSIEEQHPYDAVYELANRVAFAERLVYWRAAFTAYEAYPITGVGPGDAGFFFRSGVPAYGYTLAEISSIVRESNANFPNSKNLWIRLLAETGIVGFATFMVWMVVLLGCAWSLFSRGTGLTRTLGLIGLLSLVAQLVEGFSLDTFALPELWIVNGILTAAYVRLLPRIGQMARLGSADPTAGPNDARIGGQPG